MSDPLTVLIIGVVGAGKSSFGNCLFGEERFRASSDGASHTCETSVQCNIFYRLSIKNDRCVKFSKLNNVSP